MTRDVVKLLYIASNCINLLYIDDVHFTGFLRHHLNIYLLISSEISWEKIKPLTPEKYAQIMIAPQLSPCELEKIWSLIQVEKRFKTCKYITE